MKFKVEIKERVTGGKEIVATLLEPKDIFFNRVRLSYYLIKTMSELKNELSKMFNVPVEEIIIY